LFIVLTLEQIRSTVNRGIAILMRPDLHGETKKQERRALLRKELYQRFDFEESSWRALGVNWKRRTPKEKQEFIEVFRELLINSYASKIEGWECEKIVYSHEVLDLPYAEVHTKIITAKGEQHDISYLVFGNKGDWHWHIYDIVIEGVSLIDDYRSQFMEMLSRDSFSEMMGRLRENVKIVA